MNDRNFFDVRQPIADRLVKPLQDGKPELGWPGDPALALSWHRIENRWELLRHDPQRGKPNRHVIVARGPIGAEINEASVNELIRHLVAHDTQRRGNSAQEQLDRIIKHNEKVRKDALDRGVDQGFDAMDKFYYEMAKEMGEPNITFATRSRPERD